MTTTAHRAAALLEAPALHTAGRATVIDTGDRTLTARVVPWNVPARVTDDGRNFYTETWLPGSLAPTDRVVLYDGHVPGGGGAGRLNMDRQPIGLATGFRSEADGLYATLTLFGSSRGVDVYETARGLGYVDVSLEADVPIGGTGAVARTAAAPCALTGLAVVLPPGNGAFPGAFATAARAQRDPETDPPEDDDDDDTDPPTPPPDGGPDATPAAGRAAIAELVRAEVARMAITGQRDRSAAAGPFARFASFGQMLEAARSGRREANAEVSRAFSTAYRAHVDRLRLTRLVGRALADQLPAENPGVMPPTWLTEVFGIVDEGRPAITALGGPRSAGDSGMDIYWPYYDGDLHTIVGEQVAPKTPIVSVKVSFERGQATLRTFAGGSDVAYQLQRRSSPAYMSQYDRILQMAYGVTTEHEFAEVLTAVPGQPALTYDAGADDTGAAARAVLFAASATVKRATGRPATVALAAPDVYAALGGSAWLQPPQYGTQNVAGTASASTLQISISGLTITEAHGLAAGTMVVTNDQGATWFEDGPFLVTAEDVEKLGTNVAIWGMGAPGVFLPGAVVKITVTVPPPITQSASSSKSKS